jgi:hypothetical protein
VVAPVPRDLFVRIQTRVVTPTMPCDNQLTPPISPPHSSPTPKLINRNISDFNKAGDRASVSEERKKRATINRTEVPKVSSEIALKREAICGPSHTWSRPVVGNPPEGGGEGKDGIEGGNREEQVMVATVIPLCFAYGRSFPID